MCRSLPWDNVLVNRARDWLEQARYNLRHAQGSYIPTRYPDAHPAGPAARHYTRLEAQEALLLAAVILAFAEERL